MVKQDTATDAKGTARSDEMKINIFFKEMTEWGVSKLT